MEEVAALHDRIAQLERRVEELAQELDRAVRLIDRYGDTLGNHLKLLRTDHTALATRVDRIERRRL